MNGAPAWYFDFGFLSSCHLGYQHDQLLCSVKSARQLRLDRSINLNSDLACGFDGARIEASVQNSRADSLPRPN